MTISKLINPVLGWSQMLNLKAFTRLSRTSKRLKTITYAENTEPKISYIKNTVPKISDNENTVPKISDT